MKARLSAITLFAMMGVMLWTTTIFYPRYKQGESNATIAWDAAGYYWYLPSIFIYHDLAKQGFSEKINKQYKPFSDATEPPGFKAENGNWVLKYSCGMAIMETPFFFIGHAMAKIMGYEADGFSRPYQVAIQIGALVFAFLGMWLFRRLLLYYFSDMVVAICLFLLVVGSNYLNYTSIDGSLSHSWLFTLYVILLLCTRSFYNKPSYQSAIGIGALCGLAVLTRPTELVSILIPLLWGLEGIRIAALKERLQFFRKHLPLLVMAVVIAGCVMSIQLVYWKIISGQWLVYSYQEQGFSWMHPHVMDYTFSYRSGWINYTPIMLLAFVGIVPFLRRGPHRVMILVFWGIAYYIVTAWDIWWYAGSGGRAMIQYYPAVFFPLAALLEYLGTHKRWRMVAVPFILLATYINIWFTYQAHKGGLYDSQDGMSQQYYWRVIGRWSAPEETQKLKDGKYLYEGPMPKTARLLYSNTLHQQADMSKDSMVVLDKTHQYAGDYSMPLNRTNERWVRAEATFHCPIKEWDPWRMTQFVLSAWKGKEEEREAVIKVQRLISDGETRKLWVDMRLSHNTGADSIKVHFWNAEGDKKLLVEDLKVWAF